MPRKKTEPTAEKTLDAVEVPEMATAKFQVKAESRWNTIQCAGTGFAKGQPVELNLNDPRLIEVRACSYLEEV